MRRMWLLIPAALAIFLAALLLWLRRAIRRGGRLVRPVFVTDFLQERPESVQVIRQDNQALLIQWPEDSGRVAIYAGDDPDAIEWQTPLVVVEQESQVTLAGREANKREYFGLEFAGSAVNGRRQIVAERTLPLAGNGNFRDLGGYATTDGRATRWGRVYRSSTLARLTDPDLVYLEQLNLRLVCDLRSEAEMERDPDRLPAGVAYQPFPIVNKNPIAKALNTILFRRHRLGALMQESYYHLVDQGAVDYGRLLALLADETNLPLVFHCAAGKDRAGIAAALILKLLGVPVATILADYALSNRIFDFLTAEFSDEMAPFTRLGVPIEQLHYPLVADPAWLSAVLEHIDEYYGGIEAYLTGPAGLPAETIAAIRQNLLNP